MCEPPSSTNEEEQKTAIPKSVQAWRAAYNAVPKFTLPFLNLDISFTIASVIVLSLIRIGASHVLQIFFGWPDAPETIEAAGSVCSVIHALFLLQGLVVAFQTQKYGPADRLDEAPQWWQEYQDALLQLCTGYMVYDGLLNVVWLRKVPGELAFAFRFDDYLFLAHHFMTAFYMTSCRVLKAGHFSAMICMLLGEASNPLQNSTRVFEMGLQLDCCNGPFSQAMHLYLNVAFSLCYNLIRCVVAPYYFSIVSYHLIFTKKGRENIPLPLNIVWNFMIWAVEAGSITWIIKCHETYTEFFSHLGSGAAAEL